MENKPGLVPVPDPTVLTTQQLEREVSSLKEIIYTRLSGMDKAIILFNEAITKAPSDVDKQISYVRTLYDSKIEALQEEIIKSAEEAAHGRGAVQSVIETRLNAMDRALELLQATADKFPARIDEKIRSLEQVHEEKFRSIGIQFTERDVRTESSARDSKVAVDAALQAAKEAVAEQNRSSALAIAKSETATAKQIDQQGLLIATTAKASDEKIDDIKERLTRIEGKDIGAAATTTTHQASSRDWIAVLAVLVALGALVLAFLRHS